MKLCSAYSLAVIVLSSVAVSATAGQYNMSLEDRTATGYNDAIANPHAVEVNRLAQMDEKRVTKIAKGIYRLAGWGLANTIAIEGPDGWVIVDAGDNLEAAQDQRAKLEAKVGEVKVAAVLYTHSHYVWGAEAFRDEGTQFYGHEDLMKTLRGDQGVSVLSGNFQRRAVQQFGMLHPNQGADAFPNNLGFSAEKLSGTKAFVPPTITFKDEVIETHIVGGLTVEVLPSKTDVSESVAFYFPEKKLLVGNALAAGTVFNLYTLRGDWYRDPLDYVKAVDLALDRDIEYHVDIHGAAYIGRDAVRASLHKTRDQVQLMHDQTYRAISLGKDAQEAAEWIYMPNREGQETYGQIESHVKRIYNARLGWMGNDPYDINPLSKASFSDHVIDAIGGFDAVVKQAQASNAKQTLEGWQWALYLSSELLIADAANSDVKAIRAEAARALGQRTSSANARGFYISEALLHEGKLKFGEQTVTHMQQLNQALGAVTPAKLAASPLADNVQYLRYMVDARLAEGKHVEFNVSFEDEGASYAIALRNSVIAITETANAGPTFNLNKDDWSQLITGEKTFASIDSSLHVIDQAIGR
ncbi:MBL fold metallo-hydrolase [Halieaceae bacterium IMCC14734]|uniref:MBL fold metallo-hydrolase n=2 Tax=Candidatus Litorirhabdus singularis TaxID=2518993 RepID=A0ABT3TMB7_9GAMM|nr:MBL fold metallo-hydrolase [Candidatus Litorirhabdus singularis]